MGIFSSKNEFGGSSAPQPAPGVQLSPLTNDLITDALAALELRYFTDSDGDVGANWESFVAYFFRMGERREILNSRIIVRRKFPVEDVLRLQTFCNDWNRDKLWPKAYVRVADEAGRPSYAQVSGEVITDLEYGVTPLQLQQLLNCAVATGSSLADSIDELQSL